MNALTVALAVVWTAAVATVAVVDSARAAALTRALLLVVAPVVGAGRAPCRPAGAHGTVERQITVGVALPVVHTVLAAALFAAIMFFSTHDAVLIMLVSVFAGTLAARMATRRLVWDLRAVRYSSCAQPAMTSRPSTPGIIRRRGPPRHPVEVVLV